MKTWKFFFRLVIAEYLFGKEGECLSDKEKVKRRSILAKKLSRSEQTLKAMYRSGQGSFQQFHTALEFILKADPKSIITCFRLSPYSKENLHSLDPIKRSIYKKLEKMTQIELSLIDSLLEVGLAKNRTKQVADRTLGIKKSNNSK